MNTFEIIDKLRTDFEVSLSVKLPDAGLPDFEKYITGTPDDAKKRQLGFYFEKEENDTTTKRFNVIIQAQLEGIQDSEAWKIQDLIKAEILGYNPELIDQQSFDQLNIENFPIFETSTMILLFEVAYVSDLDDCNIES